MQALRWYMTRLRTMSPAEVAWRLRTALRNPVDYATAPWHRRCRELAAFLAPGCSDTTPAFNVCALAPEAWANGQATSGQRARARRLAERAAAIAAGRLTFFDLEAHDLGQPIDWNRDPKSGRAAPRRFAPAIDYRDFRATGDCKFVWEPNRHHHLVVLARAYRATGRRELAAAAAAQLESWLDQCPFRIGMNWRSPLELGVRLINWVWTFDLLRGSGVVRADLHERWLHAFYLHLWEIVRNYSRGSSAGNHLVGEAAGVYIAASYLPFLRSADHWADEARRILETQILRQTFADGGSREQALGYHMFILQFFTLAAIVGQRLGRPFSDAYRARLHAMHRFLAAFQAGGTHLPLFGDCDDGYVLDLDDGPPTARTLLAVGARTLGDPALAAGTSGDEEALYWLPLPPSDGPMTPTPPASLHSQAFPESGYYLLQHGGTWPDERLSVVFDCGPLGLPPLAGHGHADALSFTLRAFGRDILVDPGTYDYFTYAEWRPYFRSTRAHNTVVVDEQDQSDMNGRFLWTRHARARCLAWRPNAAGGAVVGEHDGYTRLSRPVVHRRHLELDGERRELRILDELEGAGTHTAAVCFHFAADCRVVRAEHGRYELHAGPVRVTLEIDPRLEVELLRGSTAPIGGWVSRGYHRKQPAVTLIGRTRWQERVRLTCRLSIGKVA